MNKYTPAPWEAIEKTDNRHLVRQAAGERGYICQPTNIHNAYLIAAAPEMYEALDCARTALWERKDRAPGNSPVLDSLIMAVEKALVKAERGGVVNGEV